MADVVAADVVAVLDELDRVAEERDSVHAGDEPLDDLLGAQVEPADAGDDLGVEEAAGVVVFGVGHGESPSDQRSVTSQDPDRDT